MTVEIYNASTSQWVDITPMIAWQGLTFSLNSVDAPNAGRDMSGLMHRGMVAIKEKMNGWPIMTNRIMIRTQWTSA